MTSKLCRICLDKIQNTDEINVFQTSVDGQLLSACFEILFNIEVDSEDQLPACICLKCKLGIELSINLRKQAIESNERLKNSHSLKTEEEESFEISEQDNVEFDRMSLEIIDELSSDNDETDAVEFLLNNIKDNKEETEAVTFKADSYDERKFRCTVCQKRFLKRTNLTDHLKIHAGVKNFRCSICEKSFIQYGNLKAHMRCHTKEKPFQCALCDKRYTQSSALKIHMRSHTNDRKYICHVCNKGFTNSSDLGKHKKIHSIQKDYLCKLCEQQFTQKVHAVKHIRRVHPHEQIDELLIKRSES